MSSFASIGLLILFLVPVSLQPGYERPMPALLEGYDGGQLFVRVYAGAEGAVDRAEMPGFGLMAADTVAFHFVRPALFDEALAPTRETDEPVVHLPAAWTAAQALPLHEADLRRSRIGGDVEFPPLRSHHRRAETVVANGAKLNAEYFNRLLS